MGLGISFGDTQAQRDAFRDYALRIEGIVGSLSLLGSLGQEISAADLSDADRDTLLGRVGQYRLNLLNAAGKLDDQEVDDGHVGGSQG